MGRTEAVQTLVVDFNVTIACLCLLLVFVLEKRAYWHWKRTNEFSNAKNHPYSFSC